MRARSDTIRNFVRPTAQNLQIRFLSCVTKKKIKSSHLRSSTRSAFALNKWQFEQLFDYQNSWRWVSCRSTNRCSCNALRRFPLPKSWILVNTVNTTSFEGSIVCYNSSVNEVKDLFCQTLTFFKKSLMWIFCSCVLSSCYCISLILIYLMRESHRN